MRRLKLSGGGGSSRCTFRRSLLEVFDQFKYVESDQDSSSRVSLAHMDIDMNMRCAGYTISNSRVVAHSPGPPPGPVITYNNNYNINLIYVYIISLLFDGLKLVVERAPLVPRPPLPPLPLLLHFSTWRAPPPSP